MFLPSSPGYLRSVHPPNEVGGGKSALTRELLLVPLVLMGIFAYAFSGYFSADHNAAIFQDSTFLLQPLFTHISRSLARGETPYWADAIMGGVRIYDTPQFSITYPFYFFA